MILKITQLQIQKDEVALEVLDLQKVSYAIEAKLINYFNIPFSHQEVEDLKKSDEIFLGCTEDNRLIGVLSYEKNKEGNIEIGRLVVKPNAFRKGVGTRLVKEIDLNEPNAKIINITTAKANYPSIYLFQKLGYLLTEEFETNDGLAMVRLTKPSKLKSKAAQNNINIVYYDCTVHDKLALRQLLSYSMYLPKEGKIDRLLEEYTSNSEKKIFVCVFGHEIIGLIGFDLSGTILHIAVDPKFRYQGIAMRLITEISKQFSELRAETDHEGVGFYKACGFTIESLGELFHGTERFKCTLTSSSYKICTTDN